MGLQSRNVEYSTIVAHYSFFFLAFSLEEKSLVHKMSAIGI